MPAPKDPEKRKLWLDRLSNSHKGKKNPHKGCVVSAETRVLEVDGEYWHNRPGAPERDRKRDIFLRSQGYKVARLKEKDLKADALGCVTRVLAQYNIVKEHTADTVVL